MRSQAGVKHHGGVSTRGPYSSSGVGASYGKLTKIHTLKLKNS